MKELMIHVEKAVRPLRITQGQRGAIREELLSHLMGIYDEELAHCGHRTKAIVTAINRFGTAEEISKQLQASMPWYSAAMAWIPWFSRVRSWPESTARIAWRGWMTGILFWLLIGIPWCALLVAFDRVAALQAALLWFLLAGLGIALLVPFVGLVGSIYGVYGQPRSTLRAVLFCVAGCLGPLAVIALIKLFVRPTLPAVVLIVPFIIPVGIVLVSRLPRFSAIVMRDAERGKRVGEWECLRLDD